MADFYDRRDLDGVVTFTLLPIGFEATEQSVFNDAAVATAIVEVSFDGVNVHARLEGSGPSQAITWADHVRNKIWVRNGGGPAGARLVVTMAQTR